MGSEDNVIQVLTSLSWSFPYALQSLALAVSLSWILDHHQSQKMTERLSLSQRVFDIGIATIALALATLATYCWMEGIGWFEGFGTKDEAFRGRTSLWWMMAKSVAVSAAVGLLVPMWYHLNRIKAPDQIACRLIAMNKRRLSDEIRSLQPNQLVNVVAAVGASVAAIDDDVNINEKDVYQIICSQLAGLRSSDVDVDTAEKEFDHCLELIEQGTLDLEQRLAGLNGLPMLSALMPYIASSIAFADGVYQRTEKIQVEKVQQYVKLPDLLV
jgi:tellurite resistance protein